QQIFSLYRMSFVKNMLPIVLAHENSYFSWYVYGRRDELVETYKFHEELCEFVEFDNNMKIAEPIRNVLSELKRDLEHGLDCVTQSDMQCDQFNLGVNFEDLLLLQGAISYINESKFNRALSIIRILRKQKSRCFLVRVLDVIEAGCRNKELLSNGLIVCGYMASNSQYSILKIGDVIKEVNGKPCKNYADVRYKDGSVYTIYRLNNKGDFEEMKVTISKDQPIMVFMAF
ncbi:MAG: hypothetical protein J6R18_09390, partial [Kiritimatiellae bacterium]|nr:hypothetical protein [Kiritimatiellia bacterium]